MNADDPRRGLRGAVNRADGVAVLEQLQRVDPPGCLQLGGDGLVLALEQETTGAAECARAWIARLREREWDGDNELADHLETVLGADAAGTLVPLPVDLDQVSELLEGDPTHGGGRIDLRTGEVWPDFDEVDEVDEFDAEEDEDDEADDGEDDPERWLAVWGRNSREGYRDMQDFIGTVLDPERRARLDVAIQGRGAFRRFKDALDAWPDEVDRWRAYSDERRRGRARAWLADAGYSVSPRRPPESA